MHLSRSFISPAIIALTFTFAGSLALAQAYPSAKPVTLISPWAAGGPTDIALRALAEATSKPLGQRVLIETKPGASGTIGATTAATARPDGYLLTQLPLGVFRLPFMIRTTFDPMKDLTWISNIAGYEFATIVRGDSPWKTWDDLVAHARANPGKLFYGSTGPGTTPSITMEEIAARLGIKWDAVPFKGAADSLTATRAGQVHMYASAPPWAMVKNGDLRPLIMWGPTRSPKAPDVPTLKERYGMVSNAPWGVGGPPGMDAKVVKMLNDAFRKAGEDPAFLKTLDAINMEPYFMATEDYNKWARDTAIEERKTAERLGLKP